MKTTSKILILLSGLFVILWILPQAYNMATMEVSRPPFTLYSSLEGDFLSISRSQSGVYARGRNGGVRYTEAQADSALPFFYYRQLSMNGRLPDSVLGLPFELKEVQRNNFIFRSQAKRLNTPVPALYFLMESAPRRGELYMPSDIFRSTAHGLEFIDMQTNTIIPDKSQQYTELLLGRGFEFPIADISFELSTKKEYDEGFLMVDSKGGLFHLKQVQGQPYLAKIEVPSDMSIQKVAITEFPNRRGLGFVVDQNNTIWALEHEGYKLHKTGITGFDPHTDNLTIIGNQIDWTVQISGETELRTLAIQNSNYALLDSLTTPYQGGWTTEPITFSGPRDSYIYPRFFQ